MMLSTRATRLIEAFALLTSSVQGLYLSQQASGARQPNQLRAEANRYAAMFNRTATDMLTTGSEGLQGVIEGRLLAWLHYASGDLVDFYAKQLAMPQMQLAHLLNGKAGAVGLLAQQQLSVPSPKLRDARGRQFDAMYLARTSVAMYDRWLAIVDQAQAIGPVVQISHPGKLTDGLLVSVDGSNKDMPSLQEVLQEVFYPNSTAEVIRVPTQ